jgi:MraZ protein
LRGSASARIDEKGRLKIPTAFRIVVHARKGPDVYITSLTGDSVLIYPTEVWAALEAKLRAKSQFVPAISKFLDRVAYYGQNDELDPQGRVTIPTHLRERAGIVGEVRVLGRITYLEVWNEQRLLEKMAGDPWTDADSAVLAEHEL